MNHEQGIEFMLAQGFIPSRSSQDIATFLLSTEGLNKAAIGEYLGEVYVGPLCPLTATNAYQ